MKSSSSTLSGEFKLHAETVEALTAGVTERRAKQRISRPFPTNVRGRDATGENFELACAIDNISSTGVYLRLSRDIKVGVELDLVTKFENAEGSGATALLMCQVLRNEPQPEGHYGLALAIKHYRFL